MNFTKQLYAILGKRKTEFVKLNSYQSQADFIKSLLEECHPLTIPILKMEIRWREKIVEGKDYDHDRIMKHIDTLKPVDEKIEYLRLVRKNIKNQILHQKNPDIFDRLSPEPDVP